MPHWSNIGVHYRLQKLSVLFIRLGCSYTNYLIRSTISFEAACVEFEVVSLISYFVPNLMKGDVKGEPISDTVSLGRLFIANTFSSVDIPLSAVLLCILINQ